MQVCKAALTDERESKARNLREGASIACRKIVWLHDCLGSLPPCAAG